VGGAGDNVERVSVDPSPAPGSTPPGAGVGVGFPPPSPSRPQADQRVGFPPPSPCPPPADERSTNDSGFVFSGHVVDGERLRMDAAGGVTANTIAGLAMGLAGESQQQGRFGLLGQ
jgi:hypothetical protein